MIYDDSKSKYYKQWAISSQALIQEKVQRLSREGVGYYNISEMESTENL